MDDRAASIVLQSIFGSYSNRIKSGINLIRKSTNENHQIVIRFVEDSNTVWNTFIQNTKSDIIKKSDIYCEYKPKFPTTRIKFVKDITQAIITRMVTILDAKESEDSKCAISISYIEHKKNDDTLTNLELCNVYKIKSKILNMYSWTISLCEYTYGDSETDHRLLNGPIDKYDVECVYVGTPKLIYENFLRLIALLNPEYDYKSVLLAERRYTKLNMPAIITNKFMNEAKISKCSIFDIPNTDFKNIVFYNNLWKPLDYVIVEGNKELMYIENSSNILTTNYKTIIKQSICLKIGDEYKSIYDFPTIKNISSWSELIDNYSTFVIEYDNNLYYYSDTLHIYYSPESDYKYVSLWNFTLPSNIKDYNVPIELKNESGLWKVIPSVEHNDEENELEMFNKMSIAYSSKFSELPKTTDLNPIIYLIYQYITETNIISNAHETVIHVFDSNVISSSELIRICEIDELILIGKKPSIVNYFDNIVHPKTICSLYSNTLLSNQFPNIEVANDLNINSLIMKTSFVNNSIDIIYLQNSFSRLNTFPRIIKFKEASKKILSKRGKLFVVFFNIDSLKPSHEDYEVDDFINCMFEPKYSYNKIRKQTPNESIVIKYDVNENDLNTIYHQRIVVNSFTVICSSNDINTNLFHKYRIKDKYVYVLYPTDMIRYINEYESILSSNEIPIKQFYLDNEIKYYTLSPRVFNVFGKCNLSVIPYKTKTLTGIISKTEAYAHLLNSHNEKIFNSLQLNIY